MKTKEETPKKEYVSPELQKREKLTEISEGEAAPVVIT